MSNWISEMQSCINLMEGFIELVLLKLIVYLHIFVQFLVASHIELWSFLPYYVVASYIADSVPSGFM